ncbi:YkgJ family cysteine cluster protein [Myxococcus landrumensis]|uniref:YkgJ family cysteine cluster protein n=1 Tax=Myxococcus landrumensis TaxID=2813577 RepID=A0ABX7MZS6_9BACT|nr:YkgJ family cysteine cluster protein [Myxococcus landrumus]QSQ11930.1 YkgJ family cysteine cluster protein [Myxococcus landrumus]
MPLSTLCLRCGMCCDGTLFTHVSLQPEEASALRRHGVPLLQREEGPPVLAQHCSALEGRTCTVYADRPASCRRYHCQLFSALSEKEVSLDEALGLVDEAHARIAAVERALPPATAEAEAPRSVMQRARQAAARATPDTPLPPQAREAQARAESFLDKHFRGRFGQRG